MSKARGLADLGNAYSDGALSNRNLIINGAMQVAQRGEGAFTSNEYTLDRWQQVENGSSALSTSRAQFTLGQTDVPSDPEFYLSSTLTSGTLASSQAYIRQKIEGVRSATGVVTLSFYAKADSAKDIAVEFARSYGTGGSPSSFESAISVSTVSLTTSWAYYTVTANLGSLSGKTLGTDGNDWLGVYFWMEAGSDLNARTNSLGLQSGTFDFSLIQLEIGDTATPFEHRSYGDQLRMCQRYYATDSFQSRMCGTTSGDIGEMVQYPVQMRVQPTISFANLNYAVNSSSLVFASGTVNHLRASWGSGNSTSHSVVLFDWYADAEL